MGVIPLFPSIDIRQQERQVPSVPTEPIRLLFVGRIVQSRNPGFDRRARCPQVRRRRGGQIEIAAPCGAPTIRTAVQEALTTARLNGMVQCQASEHELATKYSRRHICDALIP